MDKTYKIVFGSCVIPVDQVEEIDISFDNLDEDGYTPYDNLNVETSYVEKDSIFLVKYWQVMVKYKETKPTFDSNGNPF